MMPLLPTAHLARTLAKSFIVAAIALPGLLPELAHADQPLPPPSVPPAIQVPAGSVPFLLGHATGTQKYTCQPSSNASTGYAWTFAGPEATLVNDEGKMIMTHYAGPTWEARDGSKVVGKLEKSATVSMNAIPWLLLSAKSTTKALTPTTYIHRVNTTGGLAPARGCNASTVGDVTRVPYTADYYFYKAAD